MGVDPSLEDAIASELEARWDSTKVGVFRGAPPQGGFDGIFAIGDPQKLTPSGVPVLGTMEITSAEGRPNSIADLLLRIEARLGRLTNSQLILQNRRSYLARGARFSRRDLLLGASQGFRGHSSFPFVSEDRCEARYGCARCIQVCPAAALTVAHLTVRVNEEACIQCGLCAASCIVGAVQLPIFSDAALAGLLDKIAESTVEGKTLVLTCDSKPVSPRPGVVVEEVPSVGVIGRRQVVAAAASVECVAVVCPDGKCVGKDSAKSAIDAVRTSIADGPSAPSLSFAEGPEGLERLSRLRPSRVRRSRGPRSGDAWRDYISDLTFLLTADNSVAGLDLSRLKIADSCTLCGACVNACPHDAIRSDSTHLYFSPSMCTGCGGCVNVCPERAITLDGTEGTLSDALAEGELHEDRLVLCIGCGEPIGSARLVDKVSSLLGQTGGLVRYCPSCKQKLAVKTVLGGNGTGR